MNLFNILKVKSRAEVEQAVICFPVSLGAPCEGHFIPMEQIPDEVFSAGVLGACCGIDPEMGAVYAPIDGRISHLTDTRHAIGLEAGGMEILIHVGVDTVNMNGDGFVTAVSLGQTVKKGELLLTMDLEKIYATGCPATVIMAVANSDSFASVEAVSSTMVQHGDDVLRVSK